MSEESKQNLQDFPWEREALWIAIWTMRVEQLELDPSQEHEELEELRVRTRLCFDKAWEAFTPLLERQVSIPASAGLTPETAKAVTEHLNQMWKVRTFQSLDRTANLLMKYELELDELRKK